MKDWSGNKNSIYTTLGASNHTDKDREENDYYATDPVAIDKLLKVEQLSNFIWEPAVGGGHLAKRLVEMGHEVYCSDIIDRGYQDTHIFDFIKGSSDWIPDADIVTNPPYKYAKDFVLRALNIITPGHKVCMFLKLTFLEGKARYKDLFSKYPPDRIWIFSERVLCAKNGDFEGMEKAGGSAVAYAWFIWEKKTERNTNPTIGWL